MLKSVYTLDIPVKFIYPELSSLKKNKRDHRLTIVQKRDTESDPPFVGDDNVFSPSVELGPKKKKLLNKLLHQLQTGT